MRLKPVLAALLLAALCLPAVARDVPRPTGVIGVDASQLDPGYWVAKQKQPNRVVLERGRIDAQNAVLRRSDPSVRDIASLPPTLEGAQVEAWVQALSSRPERTLYDANGKEGGKRQIDRIMANLDLKDIPQTQVTRFGLVVRRAPLRTFPTAVRVFSAPGNTDIDRFQENAFFPGTPVAIVHESRDRAWWFVVGDLYAAWVQKEYIAEGTREQVFGYANKTPFLVVTGAEERTTTTPEQPRVSDLQLDMGIRLPWLRDWPGDRDVNGQAAYASYVVELPVRGENGRLEIVPALLPRTADVSPDYLALTRANIIRQAFKFLGERYGWGHDYDARDCSGFVSEVYRSMGVVMPRNTRDQSVSAAFNRVPFGEGDDTARRDAAARALQVGDLVYIPGHVMMVIGHDKGPRGETMPYVIHDTNGGAWLGGDGKLVSGHLNGVSVTPLTPLMFNDTQRYIDRMTNIQRIRP